MDNQQERPVWFITGCSTGLGRALAEAVLARGWRAAVTARNVDHVAGLATGRADRVLPLAVDLATPGRGAEAVRRAEERFGSVDVLVNNAGYGYLAAVEEGEDEEVRAMFETNLFGLIETTRAALPRMRERRHGHIINITSIGGLISLPATGYYHASKYAVEGLSDTLSQEVAPLGIKVTIVEPGPFRTDWAGRSIRQSKTFLTDYDKTAGERRRQTEASSGNQAGDPVRAAEALIAVVESDDPPLHLLLGAAALKMARLKLDTLSRDFDAWEKTTLGADYPES